MVEAISQMGFDLFEVKDLLDERAVWQDDVNLVLDVMSKEKNGVPYMNPLK